jgi:hypothetical protein
MRSFSPGIPLIVGWVGGKDKRGRILFHSRGSFNQRLIQCCVMCYTTALWGREIDLRTGNDFVEEISIFTGG